MAHIRLDIGADRAASLRTMKEDISAIVDALNKEPKLKQIKLGLNMSELSKDANKLKTKINELRKDAAEIKFSDQISNSLNGITSSLETLTKSVAGVTELRTELNSLATAMQNFQGISISLSSSKNPVQQMSQYGQAARALIADMKAQATDMERVLSRIYGGKGTGVLETAGRGLNVWEVAKTDSLSLQKALTDSSNLSKQMEAYALYIKLMKSVASYRKIDMTPILRLDELEKGYAAVEKLRSGEQQAETEAERLKGIFGSGINSEVLASQLKTIDTSITSVTNAIKNLGINEESLGAFKISIQEIIDLFEKLYTSVEGFKTQISQLAPKEIINKESLRDTTAAINDTTQAMKVLSTTSGTAAARAQDVARATSEATVATRGNVIATSNLSGNISGLNSTLHTMEDTRLQEIANAELLRMAEEEEAAYANRANTALQNQIETMVGIGRQTKSAESSMLSFIAAEEEANRTFQNPMAAEAELRRIAQAATSARRLLGSNMEAAGTGTDSYDRATAALEQLDRVLGYCHGNAELLAEALRVTGVNSVEEVTRLNTAVATLRDELQETGTGGTTSLRAVIDMLNQMQSLVGRNPNVTGGQGYEAITGQIAQFQAIVQACNGDVNALEQVLHDMGLQGSNVIENARLAMSNYRSEVVAATTAERANAEARRDTNATLRAGEAAYRQHTAVASQAEKRLRQWSSAQYSSNRESRDAYRNLRDSVTALDATARAYDGTEQSARDMDEAVRHTRATMSETERVLRANGDATQTLGDRIRGLAQKFGSWLSVSQVIMYAVRSIRKMIKTSVELDSTLAEMRIVTNATSSDISRFGDKVTETAKKIGASINDLIDSATVFARLGYSLDESSTLAKYTSMLQKVGNIDVSDAQNAITAITKAYDDIDADNIEATMDKLVTVGNNFPISTAEIAEGLNNAASSLSAAGNTFEQSVALLTAANTTVNICPAA